MVDAVALVEREMTVITLSEEEDARIRRTAGKALRALMEEQHGAELVDRILTIVSQSEGADDENG